MLEHDVVASLARRAGIPDTKANDGGRGMARIDTGNGAYFDPELVQEAIDKPQSTPGGVRIKSTPNRIPAQRDRRRVRAMVLPRQHNTSREVWITAGPAPPKTLAAKLYEMCRALASGR